MDEEGPVCPFCGAGFTGEMLAQLDRFTAQCGCCGGATHTAPLPPAEDICCAACGRAIYRAMGEKTT